MEEKIEPIKEIEKVEEAEVLKENPVDPNLKGFLEEMGKLESKYGYGLSPQIVVADNGVLVLRVNIIKSTKNEGTK